MLIYSIVFIKDELLTSVSYSGAGGRLCHIFVCVLEVVK